MRLIDADKLIEYAARAKLDTRELILQMIENAPTVKNTEITLNKDDIRNAIAEKYDVDSNDVKVECFMDIVGLGPGEHTEPNVRAIIK